MSVDTAWSFAGLGSAPQCLLERTVRDIEGAECHAELAQKMLFGGGRGVSVIPQLKTNNYK